MEITKKEKFDMSIQLRINRKDWEKVKEKTKLDHPGCTVSDVVRSLIIEWTKEGTK